MMLKIVPTNHENSKRIFFHDRPPYIVLITSFLVLEVHFPLRFVWSINDHSDWNLDWVRSLRKVLVRQPREGNAKLTVR